MTKRLDQRVAVITGAAKGIGRAVALRLAEEGAFIVLVDVDAEGLASTAEEVRALGSRALPMEADATDEASVQHVIDEALARFGEIHILVNNVGGGKAGRIWELSVDDWDAVMRLNLRSMFLFTRAHDRSQKRPDHLHVLGRAQRHRLERLLSRRQRLFDRQGRRPRLHPRHGDRAGGL